jgi:hypothetical protein
MSPSILWTTVVMRGPSLMHTDAAGIGYSYMVRMAE